VVQRLVSTNAVGGRGGIISIAGDPRKKGCSIE
jgi:hypothetical protein